jgi:hypothetical protein
VIAQIYGVGIITSRFTGLEFQVGVFVGLAGILVCSFLGGMKAVTWTQVAQYIILIVAYMIPVVWLSVKHTGVPIPQISAYTSALPKITALEKEFNDKASPKGAKEESVRAIFRERAAAAGQAERPGNGRPGFPRRREAEADGQGRGPQGRSHARCQGDRSRGEGRQGLPGRCGRGEEGLDRREGCRRPRRAGQGPRRSLRRRWQDAGRDREEPRHREEELPRPDRVPDDRHRRPAAHPDALLHHAFGA